MKMTALMRTGTPMSEMLDWLDTVQPFHFSTAAPYIKVEEYAEDDKYVVRADLPGIDPERDVTVSIEGDILTIHGERHEEQHEKHRSEVRYGSFTRSFTLPLGCEKDKITARYEAGVLEVSLPTTTLATEPMQIPVSRKGA